MTVSEGRHPTTLPNLPVGMTKASARGVLKKAHLVAHFSKLFSETVPAGTVVSWSSVAGDRVFYGDTVDVVISKGPAPQTIPSDLGAGVLDWSQAQSVLYGLHLVPEEATQYSSSIPAGYVVSTDPPPGRLVPGHSQVTVVVSIGPPYVKVPSLFSDSVSTAEGKLSSLGLKWQLYGPPGANYVLTQLPSANTSERVGSTVELFLY
jgi:serine/threonine-protein kinase